MKAGRPSSMIRRERVAPDLAHLLHARPRAGRPGSPRPPRAGSRALGPRASTWWMKTSSSDGTIRSIDGGRVPGRGEQPLDLAPARLGVPHHHVDAGCRRPRSRAPRAARRSASRASPTPGRRRPRGPRRPAKTRFSSDDGAQRHQAAGVDQGQPVAVLGLVEVVGGHEDGDARRPPSRRSAARSAGARSGRRRSWARRGTRRAAGAARRRRGPAAASSRPAARR